MHNVDLYVFGFAFRKNEIYILLDLFLLIINQNNIMQELILKTGLEIREELMTSSPLYKPQETAKILEEKLSNFADKIKDYYENRDNVKISEILEETGYSYSGVSEIIRETPERKNKLLFEIDKQYCKLRDAHKMAIKKADNIEGELRSVVSCFLYFHKVLLRDKIIDENKLTYSKEKYNVIVSIEGENTIKYAYYKRADI